MPIGGESWEWKVLLTQRLHSGAAAEEGVGTNRPHWNNFVFIAEALRLQVHEVVFVSCPLFTVPPALCGDPDELSLFLVSQKPLSRRGVEAGEGTVML